MSNCNPIKSRLNILQVNTTDLKGGAARVCYDLHRSYLSKDIRSWMAVGKKESCDPKIFEISSLSNTKKTLIKTNETRSSSLINHNNFSNLMDKIIRLWERKMGKEIFRFPETYKILEALPGKPSLIHFHNLHGNYFDLRAFSKLSKKFPLLLTLHDAWMLSGHCAHSIECDRWEIGCGKCPDLSIYPAIERDKTAYNWKRKRKIYNDSKFYVATPCKWLADKVVKSMLKESVISLKVIPNGVDLSVFNSLDKQKAKKKIGIKENEKFIFNLMVHGPNGCSLLIPRECFDKVGYFDSNYRFTQDYRLWFLLAKKYKFFHIPFVLIKGRVHEYQDSERKKASADSERDDLYIWFMNNISKSEEVFLSDGSVGLFYSILLLKYNSWKLPEATKFALKRSMRNMFKNSYLSYPRYIYNNIIYFKRKLLR